VTTRCPEVTPLASGLFHPLSMTGRDKVDAYCAALRSDPPSKNKPD
jgi:hypothetical protein